MDKQYSVRFFTSLLEAVQKLCREYLDFDQCVDVSGYLALEIDNYKKERFVISELLQSTGDVMSESYCTKAFKTQRKHRNDDSVLKERNANLNRLADEQRASNLSLYSKHSISPRNSFSNSRHVSSHTVVRGDQSYQSDQSAMPGNYYQSTTTSSSEWTPVVMDSIQSSSTVDTGGISSHSNKRSLPSSDESPSAKTFKTEDISLPLSASSPYSNQEKSRLSADHHGGGDGSGAENTSDSAAHGSLTESVRLPIPVEVKEEVDDCVLIDSADEDEDQDLQNVLSADDSSNSMFDNSNLPVSFSTGEAYPGPSDQHGLSQQKEHKNKNTLKKTMSNLKCLQAFMEAKGDKRPIESISEIELCDILCSFFMGLRKPDGSNYEPSSIRGMLESFERHLKSKHYGVSITTGLAFSKLNTVIKTKLKTLRHERMDDMPRRAESLDDEDVNKLWQSGQLGPHNPETIINTLWWNNSIYFRIRSVRTHHDLMWGDVTLQSNGNGNEYLMYSKQQTKTDKGDNAQAVHDLKLIVWATGDARCPVELYKHYSKLRPPHYSGPETPFYLATNTKGTLETLTWFKHQPIGKNKLYSIMKRISKNAKLPSNKNFTNLSARKYSVQKFPE